MNIPKILFVDDEESVLTVLRRHFSNDDYEILLANSARAGLEILEQTTVPVVVSDFRMPEMDGGEFLKIVCQRWPDTVRLVLSGYADISAVISAINEGEIYKFISKPWAKDELKDAVRDALKRHDKMTEMQELAEEALSINTELLSDPVVEYADLDQELLEMQIALEEARLAESAFQAAAVPLIVFRQDGRLAAMNEAARELFGRQLSGETEQQQQVELPVEVRRFAAERPQAMPGDKRVRQQIRIAGELLEVSANRIEECGIYKGFVMTIQPPL